MNKLFGMFSMYKGLLLGLIGIWLFAIVMMAVGAVAYSPVELLTSTLVFIASVVGMSWLGGLLFGVRSHLDSSLITALILALIFTPTAEASGLLALAVVGLVAGASKFVLVYKGRHIFNPAAIAAVLVSFTGLAAASWWVASPIMTPVVAIVAVVSLYQTRRFTFAGAFLAVAAAIILITYTLQYGMGLGDSLWLLLSWPLIFMAGIMLTEPLTLPPRKWQLYTEAVLVGVLFAVSFEIGIFSLNPAMALVLGNIFAFVMARRSGQSLSFASFTKLTPTTYELTFTPSKPALFVPGQFMELQIPHTQADFRGIRRSFSITSVPGAQQVSFGIKFYTPSSTYKNAMKQLTPGTEVAVSQCAGDFVLPKNSQEPLLFVAGGIGITPFISQLRTMMAHGEQRNIVLIYAVASATEIAYREVLEASGIQVVIVTPGTVGALPASWVHIDAARADGAVIGKLSGTVRGRRAYVSGPPLFVRSLRSSLKMYGARKVVTDYFTGY